MQVQHKQEGEQHQDSGEQDPACLEDALVARELEHPAHKEISDRQRHSDGYQEVRRINRVVQGNRAFRTRIYGKYGADIKKDGNGRKPKARPKQVATFRARLLRIEEEERDDSREEQSQKL